MVTRLVYFCTVYICTAVPLLQPSGVQAARDSPLSLSTSPSLPLLLYLCHHVLIENNEQPTDLPPRSPKSKLSTFTTDHPGV